MDSNILRLDSNPRMSQVVRYGDLIHTAGLVATDTNQDVRGQTTQILNIIDSYIIKMGSSKDKILSATIWLSNMDDYEQMNLAWDEWVSSTAPPVRACVEARLASPKFKVEIQISALA